MGLIDILLAVLIITAIALCVYLVISLKRLNKTVEILQKDVHDLYEKTIPLVENLTEITERASRVTTEAENYWQTLVESVESIKTRVSNFGKFSGNSGSGNPIDDFVKNLRAIGRGIAAFWENFKN